jgi:hypothetical protein
MQPNSGIDAMGGGIGVWQAATGGIDVARALSKGPEIRFLAKS